MKNVYAHIKQLKEEIDSMISKNPEDLNNPEVIDISKRLDKLIVESMVEEFKKQA